MRVFSRLPSFSGEDADWRQWSFVFESMAGLVHLDTMLDHCVTETEANLQLDRQSEDVAKKMKALYHILITTCKGKALTTLQMIPRHNGAIGWKRMKEEYEPKSGGRLTAILMGLLRPEWDSAAK